jgi:hypothetical protein
VRECLELDLLALYLPLARVFALEMQPGANLSTKVFNASSVYELFIASTNASVST